MTTTYEQAARQGATPARNPALLWGVIGALGTAVVALAAVLVWVQRPAPTPLAAPTVAGAPLAPAPAGQAAGREELLQDGPAEPPAKPAAKAVEKRPAATPRPVPHPAPAPMAKAPAAAMPAPAPEPARAICYSCGTVESVTQVQREAPTSGMGAVAGGVLGAVVGNQVGKGGGRTAATVLGAVGGGLLGNTVEKRMRPQTVYQIGVRMENGQLRTVERAAPVNVGSRVTLEGETLRTADGAVVPELQRPAPAPQQAPGPVYTSGGG
ncbi:glycine zipper 2TM domain-containing protein [Ramlibacter sp. 2FC]|uniref:glycine zipper 2TM domain-containing protein n=1 Tax=Ramlibacter sp. 2FC TaxID=2502188 RepID=UPI0010F851AE|nr:glycine zipper 2TM domain-containing protein [Ramlibacter sp. 2FC]